MAASFMRCSVRRLPKIMSPHRMLKVPASPHLKGYHEKTFTKYAPQAGSFSGIPISQPFTVLGIETSCDDTCAAVVRSDGHIMSNIVSSQYLIHQRFGGVVPGMAMMAHQSNIDDVIKQSIRAAGLESIDDVDAIAVTRGPGLELCLRIGLRKAQV